MKIHFLCSSLEALVILVYSSENDCKAAYIFYATGSRAPLHLSSFHGKEPAKTSIDAPQGDGMSLQDTADGLGTCLARQDSRAIQEPRSVFYDSAV